MPKRAKFHFKIPSKNGNKNVCDTFLPVYRNIKIFSTFWYFQKYPNDILEPCMPTDAFQSVPIEW